MDILNFNLINRNPNFLIWKVIKMDFDVSIQVVPTKTISTPVPDSIFLN
jgi:hypothetical protein